MPLAWLVGVYLASLGGLLIQSFWRANELSPNPVHVWNLDNYRQFLTGDSVYRTIAERTLGFAAVTTVVDVVLAFPLAYYLTRVASPRARRFVLVLVTVPLFSSLIVRLYSVRLILDDGGILHAALRHARPQRADRLHRDRDGDRVRLRLAALHDPARSTPRSSACPGSLIEASRDLGAKGGDDVPHRRPAARLPRRRGRLDLHVLAHARRLHHARRSSAATTTS